jgi:hypothetical protein
MYQKKSYVNNRLRQEIHKQKKNPGDINTTELTLSDSHQARLMQKMEQRK